ncbi:MAG: translocation/assembly module TamB domain-containing protein [Pseudomonadota bacterium]
MRQLFALSLSFLMLAQTSVAQDDDDDGGFLTRTIEGALSGAGRDVNIEGFAGVLSSEATFDRMTIADDQGIWLILEDVSLVWSRTALLRGRLRVDSLTAAKLDVQRLPEAEEQTDTLPAAEAEEFKLVLPELPVSINVDAFEVTRIDLGAPILGEPASLILKASTRFDDEGLFLDLAADRIDETAGALALRSTVLRDGGEISINLSLNEAQGGIASHLLNLPGDPSVNMLVAGTGPLDNFAADIRVSTDETPRLIGQVSLLAEPADESGEGPNRRIRADLGGDITALIAPEYEEFFGPDVGLNVTTLLVNDGSINVEELKLAGRAVELEGVVRLNADMWPSFINIDGEISRNGAPVLLPGSDAGVSVEGVTLDVSFDAAQGDAFEGVFDIRSLEHDALTVEQTELRLDGTLDGTVDALGSVLADIVLNARGVALTDDKLSDALGSDIRGGARLRYNEEEPIEIANLTLTGADYGLSGDAVVEGLENGFLTKLNLDLVASDLSRFAQLAGQALEGAVEVSVSGDMVPLSSMFDLRIEGVGQNLAVGIPEADGVLTGRTDLSFEAARNVSGTFVRGLDLQNEALDVTADATLRTGGSAFDARVRLDDIARVVPEYAGAVALDAKAEQSEEGWFIDAVLDAPYDARAYAKGLATGPEANLEFEISVPDVKPVVPEAEGPLLAQGRLWQAETGYQIDVKADGPFDASLIVEGLATGPDADLGFELSVPDVQPVVPQADGPLLAKGRLWQAEEGYQVDVKADGPFDASLVVDGLATGPEADVDFNLSVPDMTAVSPQVQGPLLAQGRVWQDGGGYNVDVDAEGPFEGTFTVDGLVTGPDAEIGFSAGLPNIGVFYADLSGPLSLEGEVARAGTDWAVDTAITGPAGMTADVEGTAAVDASSVDMTAIGSLPLGLAAPFIAPRTLNGNLAFDLDLNGSPGLDALSGQITTSGASASDPNLRLALQDIEVGVDLANSAAQINVGAAIATGGRFDAGGTVNLTTLNGDLAIDVQQAVLVDPNIYSATLGADISVAGPLSGGALVAGDINIAEVNITIPGTGVTSIGAIPEINHVGAPSGVTTTRARAGVLPPPEDTGPAGPPPPPFELALNVNAPERLFVRGRGLDAELGGDLQLRGKTNNVISSGSFELIRGRFNLVGQRFDLDEGTIDFQGSLVPYVRFMTTTDVEGGTASITVDGPANDPEITFSAVPEVPEDEVLALILFGRSVSSLSAFQALQLANSIAILTGRGGLDVIGGLRGGIGLDNLDVNTDEDGGTSVTAGKYITDDIYTDVTTNSDTGTDVSLNIDLTDSLTGRATVAEDGNSSVGLFFERDY